MGEDDTYVYFQRERPVQLEGFFDDVGNMFKRMVKFTPKSFTPGNIYKGIINTTLTTATGGLYHVLPKDVKKTVFEVAKVAVPVVAGGALFAANPALSGVLSSTLSKAGTILGKHASTIGGSLFSFLSKLAPGQQAQAAQAVTPQDVVYMEQHPGELPAHLQPLFTQAAQQSYYPPAPPMSLEEAYGALAPEPVQAGMGMGPGMMWFIGLSAVGLVLFGMPQRKR